MLSPPSLTNWRCSSLPLHTSITTWKVRVLCNHHIPRVQWLMLTSPDYIWQATPDYIPLTHFQFPPHTQTLTHTPSASQRYFTFHPPHMYLKPPLSSPELQSRGSLELRPKDREKKVPVFFHGQFHASVSVGLVVTHVHEPRHAVLTL